MVQRLRGRRDYFYKCKQGADYILRSNCVGINLINDLFNAKLQHEIYKHFHDAAVIDEGCILQNGKILHKTVMDNVLHDLVYEVDLIAIKGSIIPIFRNRNSSQNSCMVIIVVFSTIAEVEKSPENQ